MARFAAFNASVLVGALCCPDDDLGWFEELVGIV